jgi:hypothetical protein
MPEKKPDNFKFPMAFKYWIYLATETLTFDTSLPKGQEITQMETFRGATVIVFDPFNDRVKQFVVDETYKTPTKAGHIYEFSNNRVLMYEKYKNVCIQNELQNPTFFDNFRNVWDTS